MTMPPAPEPYSMQETKASTTSTNPLAIVSLITSILPLYLVGVITGHIALSQIRRTGAKGHGLALAGVILGYIGIVVSGIILAVALLFAAVLPAGFIGAQANAHDSAVQSDITNAKVAVISRIIADPLTFPTLSDLSEFVPYPDTQLTLSGDASGFCIEGYSLSNDAAGTATHFATSDISGTAPGTCADGVLVPAP